MPVVIRKEQRKSVEEVPDTLKPYIQHGVDLSYGKSSKEASGECPFCYKEDKFSVNIEKGVWQCFTCSTGGSIYQFIESLMEVSDTCTKPSDYTLFAKERGLEYPDTLIEWRACKSVLTGQWMIPALGLDHTGKLRLAQLYIYTKMKDRMVLMPTTGLKHCLFGLHSYDKNKNHVILCEGPWDGMRMWETLKTLKPSEDGFASTASPDGCLLSGINVLAAPSSSSFSTAWQKWFKGKDVSVIFDNDYPTKTPNGERAPAGMEGMKRVAKRIGKDVKLEYVYWGPDGYDPDLPNGYDVKDALKDKADGLKMLLGRLKDMPPEWRVEGTVGEDLTCRKCTDWRTLVNSWRKALKWTDGLDHALAVMLACISSTKSIGDQLWIKVIGPPSSGKSTLCEAISINKKHILAKSTIRGFHSGYKSDNEGKIDNSLIPMLVGKTLVTKDGDTLLQSPNLGQILSEARDLFDGSSRTHYRNKTSRDYEGIRMTWLLCGTSSLRSIDASELGQRFLDCVIMDKIDLDLEDDILWRMANKAAAHVDIEADGTVVSQYSPELGEAMELTGGYIDYLKSNTSDSLSSIQFSEEAMRECVEIGKFVAYMRSRPSKTQNEKAERELAARLVSQHVRLAKCLALVLNRKEVDREVIRRTHRVGLDTSRGVVFDACRALYNNGIGGLNVQAIMLHVNCTDGDLRKILRFLREIGVVEFCGTTSKKNTWRLTRHLTELFRKILGK